MSARPFHFVAVLAAVVLALAGCEESPADDDSAAGDDTAADDDATPADPVAPVISDLSIELAHDVAGDELVFAFHYEDPDADIPGGLATIYVDGAEAATASIPKSATPYTVGDIELGLAVPNGNLTYGARFLFGVSLADAGERESNRLELDYTIPDEP